MPQLPADVALFELVVSQAEGVGSGIGRLLLILDSSATGAGRQQEAPRHGKLDAPLVERKTPARFADTEYGR